MTTSMHYLTSTLRAIAALALLAAVAITIGTVGQELAQRASTEESVAVYPAATPSLEQAQVLADTLAMVPALGGDWRWAELDSRGSCGLAFHRSRVVLLDPGMKCELRSTIFHEWLHLAEIEYYGGGTPDGTVTSDLLDEDTGKRFVIPVQEVVADCGSLALLDEFGHEPTVHSYLQRLGGCPPDTMALAVEIIEHTGVRLTPGRVHALAAVGAGVA